MIMADEEARLGVLLLLVHIFFKICISIVNIILNVKVHSKLELVYHLKVIVPLSLDRVSTGSIIYIIIIL